jgi:predicted Na+-dependent transporter
MTSNALQDLAVQALSVTLLFSVGLGLDLPRLWRTLMRWELLLGVVLYNFVAVPALAITSGWFVSQSAVVAGIVLTAIAPAGGTGTLLTRIGGGNMELSVCLLGIMTALALPVTPWLAVLLMPADATQSLPVRSLAMTLFGFQFLPLTVGMLLRRLHGAAADRADRVARPLSNVLFVGLVAGLVALKGALLVEVGLPGLAFMIVLVLVSLLLPMLARLDRPDLTAVSLTSAVRNISLALLLSTSFFGDLTTITVLAYGLAMYLIGVPWARWLRRAV